MRDAIAISRKTWLAALLIVTCSLGPAGAALAQDPGQGFSRLGKVKFKVECSPAAQQEFNHAMALYHSFAWPQAAAAFTAIARTDPACGMAHWGRAMVMLDNPFVWPVNLPPQKLDEIAAALDAARAAGLKSQREKDYVEAVAAFVRDRDTKDHRTRVQAFQDAMAKVAASYPDDREAAILQALVTSANFNPADRTYANQLQAARILEPIFKAQPDHPGVAHYLIHSYDYPSIASQGVEAAKRYAAIAPDAPHALHMPSHIFTRLGYWRDSVASNTASAKVDGGGGISSQHAYDYMVYAHLQLGQDGAARQVTQQSLGRKPVDHFAAAFAYAAMPARLALERGEWKEAAGLPLHAADAYPWKKYPQAEAVNAFARGVGAARSGDADGARQQQARLQQLREAMTIPYWREQIDIQADIIGALTLCAEGKTPDCIEALRKAAAREDATEKHVVTPGPILPAREFLADTLLEAKQPQAALKEYDTVLVKEPNRYRAIAGAMQAAQQAGNTAKARTHAAHLVSQAADADSERPSLQQAKLIAAGR